MRRYPLAAFLTVAWLGAAFAQAPVEIMIHNAGNATVPVSSSNPMPVSGTFSASLSGFTPGLTYASLTATGSSASVALPLGVTVQFQNAGTTTVSCTLGIGSATALASELIVQPGSTKTVVVGSNTFGACIDQTGSVSNVVVLAGGSGLGNDSGGGSSGGTGGAVTGTFWQTTQPVSGTFWQTTQPVSIATAPALVASTALIGNTGTLYPAGSTPITASATGTTAATTATLAGVSAKSTYICGFSIRANATAAATANSTVTGTVTGTLNYTQWTAPLASGIGLTEQIFSPCVIASATNTGIAVISAAPGTGGVVSVSAWGFQL